VSTPSPANAVTKKLRDLPNLAGKRMRKYRSSNQLCGPANRNTVTIETCSGTQLANIAAAATHITTAPANTRTP
jgi:hypothetical protein